MLPLYPEIKPYAQHRLAVEAPHELYIEESGNPDGIPILYVHGGPGAGAEPRCRRFFDPGDYRIILFDQRGAGRSTPHACLDNNHSAALVEDIEAIRKHLGIDQWLLFGGSWGSTLSLLYAEAHPERVSALILRGIFLCRPQDIRWFYQEGASRIFPDAWRAFTSQLPPNCEDNVGAYYELLTGNNELARMAAAKHWSMWEAHCATLRPNTTLEERLGDPHVAMAMARIEAHFFINNGFLEDDQIVRNAHRLRGIPGVIIHGRYDMVCPLDNATALAEAWPNGELQIVRDAGHSAFEPAITDALIRATDDYARRFRAPTSSA